MGDARQMAAMMRRMGIETRELDGVEEVVIRTKEREYRFKRPAVSVVKAQGQETWQVVGKATTTDRAPAEPVPTAAPAPSAPYAPTMDDVRVVMEAAKVPEARAREALLATNGDLAEAILKLG